jgi:hypothetical protein
MKLCSLASVAIKEDSHEEVGDTGSGYRLSVRLLVEQGLEMV